MALNLHSQPSHDYPPLCSTQHHELQLKLRILGNIYYPNSYNVQKFLENNIIGYV